MVFFDLFSGLSLANGLFEQVAGYMGKIMQRFRKILLVAVLGVVAFFALMGAKWYNTTVNDPIHPERGVYGMDGLEIWIDINARMPDFAREWGCKTLRDREKLVLGGQNTKPPYSCQEGFSWAAANATVAYDVIVKANVDQSSVGLSADKAQALRVCFDAKMAAAVTAEDIEQTNDDVASDAARKVVMAVSESARACKKEIGG